MPNLSGRKIILGITGGIAAYKTPELVRGLKKAGAEVRVLMTENAARFVTAETLATVSGHEVLRGLYEGSSERTWTQHVTLGLWADLFMIAPATAQTLAKLASGMADSLLTAAALSARCPVVVCPSMDHDMFEHPATQRNLKTLTNYGYRVIQPQHGELASGLVGQGRMPEPDDLLAQIDGLLAPSEGPWQGRKVVVSAGPTREALDPVRYLTNHSSGSMGYALAEAASALGAAVTLISGPVSLPRPVNMRIEDVETAEDMAGAVLDAAADADLVIMAAAVADYRPARVSERKIKKSDADLTLELVRTTDILRELGRRKPSGQVLVGFALETHDERTNALEKLRRKNADWIVLNNPLQEGAGFGPGTNRITLLGADGSVTEFPVMQKKTLAVQLLQHIPLK